MFMNLEKHFTQLPEVHIQRSIIPMPNSHKTSFDVGELIPVYISEILPGDSVKMKISSVVRLQTMLTPIMDNLAMDITAGFIPMRLTWNHTKEFYGEASANAWVPQTTYQIPSISSPQGGFAVGTIADHMGLPVGVEWSNTDENRPSALPFRAYALWCNEYWRDQNLTDPLNVPLGDSNQTGTNGGSYINDVANGGMPFKVAKYHDVFTSALPAPLKAQNPVTFPLISGDKAPVLTSATALVTGSQSPLLLNRSDGTVPGAGVVSTVASDNTTYIGTGVAVGSHPASLYPSNLYADLSTSVGAVTVNELRLAFQLQKFYEKNARAGTRMIEMIREHFGVISPDARLQRPEYLGGKRVPIVIHEVTNTAQTNTDFLGDLGGKSVTSDVDYLFEKSFSEPGYLLITVCVRYDHTYAQGIEKFWLRRQLTDFYFPVFANIGEQPVQTCEICATSQNMAASDVFGYQEAWYDYRMRKSLATGEMRPGVQNTLASWHLADYYQNPPTLSDAWIREDKTNVDRCLAVTSQNSNQVFADFYFDAVYTRPMPVYSIPGLIDHH